MDTASIAQTQFGCNTHDATVYVCADTAWPHGYVDFRTEIARLVADPLDAPDGIDSPDKATRNAAKVRLAYVVRAVQSYRNYSGTIGVTGCAVDFDEADEATVRAEIAALGWSGWLYPSPSHFRSDGSPDEYKVRFMPDANYSRPLTPLEHKRLYVGHVLRHAPHADRCMRLAHFGTFLPAVSDANRPRWWCERIEGSSAPIDVDAILPTCPEITRHDHRDDVVREGADYVPVHPMLSPQRHALAQWPVFPHVSTSSSASLTGDTAYAAIARFAEAASKYGLPWATLRTFVAFAASGVGWDVAGIDDPLERAWESAADAWETELYRIAPLAPAIEPAPYDGSGLLMGAMGSGKTTEIAAWINREPTKRVIVILPRVKQCKAFARLVGGTLYGDPGHETAPILVVTVASAWKYLTRETDIVVLEEAGPSLRCMSARSYKAIARMCRTAESVVCVGADVDADEHAVLRDLTGRALPVTTLDALAMPRTWTIRDYADVLEEIVDRPACGPCIFVGMDVRWKALALADLLRNQGKRVGVYVGGSEDLPTNEDVAALDVVIANHTLAEMISITAPVAKVYLLCENDKVHPKDRIQLGNRCRNVLDTEIVVGEPRGWAKARPAPDHDAIRAAIVEYGGAKDPTGPLACRWLRMVHAAQAKAWPSLRSWALPGGQVARVEQTRRASVPKPGSSAVPRVRPLRENLRKDLKMWIDMNRRDAAKRVVDAPAVHTLPVRPTPEQVAGRAKQEMLDHGLGEAVPAHAGPFAALVQSVDLDVALRDLSGAVRRSVRRRALALLDPKERAAMCEFLEPEHAGDRKTLIARAELDALFLAGPGDRSWPDWSRAHRRRFGVCDRGLLSRDEKRLGRQIKGWQRELDAADDACSHWLDGVRRRMRAAVFVGVSDAS